jgi:hypothetical protein
MNDAIRLNMPEAEYHSHPALSSTQARLLLDSPAKYKYSLTHPQEHKDAFDLGTSVHSKVLGVGATAVVLDFPDMRTKAAREARDEARAAGQIVLSATDMAKGDGMAEAVLAHPEARQVLESIEGREVSLFADVEDVAVRARFDIYGGNRAADLKSARDASPKGFNATVGRYGYHIQDRFYDEAHQAITGMPLESFHFLVVESTAPYLVAVYELDYMWEDLAKERTARARELYKQCTATDVWPGYMGGTLTPPTWAIFDADRDEEEIQI